LQDTPKFTQIGIFGLKIHIPSGNPIWRDCIPKSALWNLNCIVCVGALEQIEEKKIFSVNGEKEED
jgi:hypothetical protein